MKTLIQEAAIASAAFALLSVAAQAETMRVSVPFQFRAGNDIVPAGQYIVQMDAAQNLMTVRLPDGSIQCRLRAFNARRATQQDVGMLVFHRYGNAYFLRQAFQPGYANGYQLIQSKAEREMAKAGAPVAVARVVQ